MKYQKPIAAILTVSVSWLSLAGCVGSSNSTHSINAPLAAVKPATHQLLASSAPLIVGAESDGSAAKRLDGLTLYQHGIGIYKNMLVDGDKTYKVDNHYLQVAANGLLSSATLADSASTNWIEIPSMREYLRITADKYRALSLGTDANGQEIYVARVLDEAFIHGLVNQTSSNPALYVLTSDDSLRRCDVSTASCYLLQPNVTSAEVGINIQKLIYLQRNQNNFEVYGLDLNQASFAPKWLYSVSPELTVSDPRQLSAGIIVLNSIESDFEIRLAYPARLANGDGDSIEYQTRQSYACDSLSSAPFTKLNCHMPELPTQVKTLMAKSRPLNNVDKPYLLEGVTTSSFNYSNNQVPPQIADLIRTRAESVHQTVTISQINRAEDSTNYWVVGAISTMVVAVISTIIAIVAHTNIKEKEKLLGNLNSISGEKIADGKPIALPDGLENDFVNSLQGKTFSGKELKVQFADQQLGDVANIINGLDDKMEYVILVNKNTHQGEIHKVVDSKPSAVAMTSNNGENMLSQEKDVKIAKGSEDNMKITSQKNDSDIGSVEGVSLNSVEASIKTFEILKAVSITAAVLASLTSLTTGVYGLVYFTPANDHPNSAAPTADGNKHPLNFSVADLADAEKFKELGMDESGALVMNGGYFRTIYITPQDGTVRSLVIYQQTNADCADYLQQLSMVFKHPVLPSYVIYTDPSGVSKYVAIIGKDGQICNYNKLNPSDLLGLQEILPN